MSHDNLKPEKVTRPGDASSVPQRRSRTFERADGWYFMTREGVDIGPFPSEEAAQDGVRDYAGFAMDADRIYLDSLEFVPDESDPSPVEPVDYHIAAETDMFDRRRGEAEAALQRSTRIFERAGEWFFATREGNDIGPFNSRSDAERGVEDYVSFSLDTESADS